jgi:hypothetical protein
MLNRRQYLARRAVSIVLFTAGMSSFPLASATAQDHQQPSPVISIVKEEVLDPTTYAPAVIAYDATVRDWNTSQPFFRNGFTELNPRFTISGLPNDVPVSYSDGRRRILSDAVGNLGLSLFNNFTERVFERTLMTRYPEHRKMVRTAGWIERVAFGASMSYVLSAQHYRQARSNALIARELGYR